VKCRNSCGANGALALTEFVNACLTTFRLMCASQTPRYR